MGLCPKTPLNADGRRMDPAMSEATPITDAPDARRAACKYKGQAFEYNDSNKILQKYEKKSLLSSRRIFHRL